MRKENKFLFVVTFFILFIVIMGFLLLRTGKIVDSDWTAFASAALLTTVNFYAGIISLIIGLRGSEKKFLILLFGGIFFRLLFMLSAVFFTLKFLQIRTDVFIFVIFGFYSFYLITEIYYFYIVKGRDS